MAPDRVNTTLCVITLTVDRPVQLRRAIDSVRNQTGNIAIRHLIASEQVESLRHHPLLSESWPWVTWVQLPGRSGMGYASARLARLRTQVLELVREPWVAYLDDDNRAEPGHYADLLALAERRGLPAVHSWRWLEEADGRPFDGMRYPWHPSPARAMALWRWCTAHGVITPYSCIVRDGIIEDPLPENVATVDMNEWLLRTHTLRQVGFDLYFSRQEQSNQVGEDDKLLRRLRLAKVPIGCNERASLVYRLGGVSNR